VPRSEWGSDTGEYVIGPGDVISITVYQQAELSTKAKVRTDGRIGLTFIGEIVVAGKKPAVLAQELELRLRQFIVSPRVVVNVDEAHPIAVSMLGEGGTKGSLTLEPPATLLQAIAQAGGLSEYASKDKIFILRRVPVFRRIRFTYEAIVNNESGAAMFPLRTGDVIFVE
jgi:polysaccharide export outer membrane protein